MIMSIIIIIIIIMSIIIVIINIISIIIIMSTLTWLTVILRHILVHCSQHYVVQHVTVGILQVVTQV